MPQPSNPDFIQEYWIDAWQRSILSLDVLRQRGNTYLEQSAKNAPQRARASRSSWSATVAPCRDR